MNLDDKEYKYNILKILHKSRETKLTFLSDRQFKTTILAVTVDLIVADRLYSKQVEFRCTAIIILTIALSIFNLIILNYIISKHSSYATTRKEYKNHERSLYGLIGMDLLPSLSDIKDKKFYKWISDGTTMFSIMIIFAWVLTIIALWGNIFMQSKKDIRPNVIIENTVKSMEQKMPNNIK
jgi:hypothetical protein